MQKISQCQCHSYNIPNIVLPLIWLHWYAYEGQILQRVHSQRYKSIYTELAALEIIDRLLTQLDGQLIPINFYLDLSKAFDSLNHNILLNKLSYYGVGHMANTLLRSYLSNRKQYVLVGDVSSSTQPITSGGTRVCYWTFFIQCPYK